MNSRRDFLGFLVPLATLVGLGVKAAIPETRVNARWVAWWWQPCPGIKAQWDWWVYCIGPEEHGEDNWPYAVMNINRPVQPQGTDVTWQINFCGTQVLEFGDTPVEKVQEKAVTYYRAAMMEVLKCQV